MPHFLKCFFLRRSGSLGLTLLLAAVPAFCIQEGEVHAFWDDLAKLVEYRQVEMVLTNGVHVRGTPQRVLPEALEIRVKHTSDPVVVSKGLTTIPREQITVLTVERKSQLARTILMFALPAAWIALRPMYSIFGFEEMSLDRNKVAVVGIGVGAGVAGYLIGDHIDAKKIKKLRVVLAGRP